MHRDFYRYLDKNGNGIDYSHLIDYDTKSVLEAHLLKQHPYWIKRCEEGIKSRNKGVLDDCISTAPRIGLDKAHPDLMKQAYAALANAK